MFIKTDKVKRTALLLSALVFSFVAVPVHFADAAAAYETASNERDYMDEETGKNIKVYGQCVSCSTWSYWPCDFSTAPSLPQCPVGYYTERYYADRNTNFASRPAPAISSVSDSSLYCRSISEKHRGCECSADIRDRRGDVFAEKSSVTSGMVNTYAECEVSCSYRVCVQMDACDRADAPECDDPGYCQEGMGQCIELPDGTAGCKYGLSNESCDADGNQCTFDSCASNPDGTASCKAGSDVCGGLVPCGRLVDNPSTEINETRDCGVCAMVYMSSNIVNFLMGIVTLLTLLAMIIGGFLYIKSGGDTSLILMAKQNFAKVIQGFVIVLVAWVIINVLMVLFGFSDPLGDERWMRFDCKF